MEGLLEMEIDRRLNLALLANSMKFPFVYTPIKATSCIAKSEYESDVLNCKWEDFFRQVADDFVHINSLDEGRVLLLKPDVKRLGRGFFFTSNHFLHDEDDAGLCDFAKEVLAKVEGFSSKLGQKIKKTLVREFIKKSHGAYMDTFASDARVSFADDTLQVVFIMHEDGGLRAPFFFDRLVPLLDFVEERANDIGCNLQVHLFTSFEFDQVVPDCWNVSKAQALEAACSRPYVHFRQAPSFEEMVRMSADADLTWVSGTFYGRSILRKMLVLVSRPEQVLIEMLPEAMAFRLNHCFLMWDGERFCYEKKKMSEVLNVARYGSHHRDELSGEGRKAFSASEKPLRKKRFNIASGVIDGAGSCFLKIFLMQLIADYHDLQYVHTSRMSIDHNYKADPDWERKWEGFFMPGEGRPGLNEVFGDESPDVYYSYNLPAFSCLDDLELSPDCLVVSNMSNLHLWPVPDEYLKQKIAQTRTAFQERHRQEKDSFNPDVVNVAVHVRAVDNYVSPVKKIYQHVANMGVEHDLSDYAERIRTFHDTMQKLETPFQLHIYSDARRHDLEPLLEFGDIHLHLSEEEDDWCLSCLEMSRADVLLLGFSRISYSAALLAQPNQLQLVTSCLEKDLLRMLICSGNAYYREHDSVLKDVRLVEGFLNKRS